MDILWSIAGQGFQGNGKLFNISVSEMLFETDQMFEPKHGIEMSFSSEQMPAMPPNGKLIWFRKVTQGQKRYQCGIRFVKEPASYQAWGKWLDENILKLADAADNNVLNRYLIGDGNE